MENSSLPGFRIQIKVRKVSTEKENIVMLSLIMTSHKISYYCVLECTPKKETFPISTV